MSELTPYQKLFEEKAGAIASSLGVHEFTSREDFLGHCVKHGLYVHVELEHHDRSIYVVFLNKDGYKSCATEDSEIGFGTYDAVSNEFDGAIAPTIDAFQEMMLMFHLLDQSLSELELGKGF